MIESSLLKEFEYIGVNIRMHREAKGLTQQALADASYITNGYISKIERGSVLPSIVTLSDIAKALDVSFNTIIAYKDEYLEYNNDYDIELSYILKRLPMTEKARFVEYGRMCLRTPIE